MSKLWFLVSVEAVFSLVLWRTVIVLRLEDILLSMHVHMFLLLCSFACCPSVSLSICCPAVMQIILPVRAEHCHNRDDYQCLHSRSLCMLKLFIGRLLQVGLIKLVSMSVHPSTKSFSDFNEIWYVDWGLWVIHDGVTYDPIQGQGHRGPKVVKKASFKSPPPVCM